MNPPSSTGPAAANNSALVYTLTINGDVHYHSHVSCNLRDRRRQYQLTHTVLGIKIINTARVDIAVRAYGI